MHQKDELNQPHDQLFITGFGTPVYAVQKATLSERLSGKKPPKPEAEISDRVVECYAEEIGK
jgi:hypothetical protein